VLAALSALGSLAALACASPDVCTVQWVLQVLRCVLFHAC
jgi:hypothetical protein